MPKPLSDDCRKKLKAIEEDLLNIIRGRRVGGRVDPIEFQVKEVLERIKAKRSSTVGDEDCKKNLKEIEDELLLLTRKPMVNWQQEIENLVARKIYRQAKDQFPGGESDG